MVYNGLMAKVSKKAMTEARAIEVIKWGIALAVPPSNHDEFMEALAYVRENPTIEVPTHLRNQHPPSMGFRIKMNYERPPSNKKGKCLTIKSHFMSSNNAQSTGIIVFYITLICVFMLNFYFFNNCLIIDY